ncbi:MAG TPA: hypothetical protein VFS00_34410, partial [Polyangiaceae bacterium]|nr:hypothetical protein [Polyangiaceae bacterium]
TMRFDYYGCGDSLGESVEATCARWRRDVEDACRELRRRTGASSVAAVGVRLGATLLYNAAGDLGLSRLVSWDPVCDGAEYYAEMADAHRRYVSSMHHLRLGRRPERLPGAEELLGTTYSDEALRELRGLAVARDAPNHALPARWLITSQPARQQARFAALYGARVDCRADALDVDCGWHDLARLEDVLPDVGIAAALAAMATERAVPGLTPAAGTARPSFRTPSAGVARPSFHTPSAGIARPSFHTPSAGVERPSFHTPAAGVERPSGDRPPAAGAEPPPGARPPATGPGRS